MLTDPEWRRQGRGELQCVVIDSAHGPAAYALYRLTSVFERGVQSGSVSVVEALGDSPAATGAIWRYLLDVDWMARVKASLLPVDHPLLLLLAEPRRLNVSLRDGLWVRLVDVGAGLSSRGFAARDPVVVELTDAFCSWNAGRWRVSEAGAERTDAQPELRCDVSSLASAYLGGFSWAELARGLRVAELRSGAIARADALFQSDRAPWCPEIF